MDRLTAKKEDRYFENEEFWVDAKQPSIDKIDDVYFKLADFEDFMEENGFESLEELKKRLYFDKNLILDLETIRADKNNPLKPRFYYDENLSDDYFPYAFCARPYDDNMSLHSFMKNGVLCGYASEHYDIWCKNTKPIKEMNFNEWAIKFIMPLIQENQELKDRWQKLKELLEEDIKHNEKEFNEDSLVFARHYITYGYWLLDRIKELEDNEGEEI